MADKLHYDSNDRDDDSIAKRPYCDGEGVVKINSIFPSDVHHYYYVECELCKASTYIKNVNQMMMKLYLMK